jgi:hypothetical protein
MRELRKVFFPSVSDENGEIGEESQGKFTRNSTLKNSLEKNNSINTFGASPRNPRIANNSAQSI